MGFYQKHVFFCGNVRQDGRRCCGADRDLDALLAYAKQQLKAHDCYGPGKIRISRSACLGRCALGPCLVIYPDNCWYRCVTQLDFDHILQEHLLGQNKAVSLLLPE